MKVEDLGVLSFWKTFKKRLSLAASLQFSDIYLSLTVVPLCLQNPWPFSSPAHPTIWLEAEIANSSTRKLQNSTQGSHLVFVSSQQMSFFPLCSFLTGCSFIHQFNFISIFVPFYLHFHNFNHPESLFFILSFPHPFFLLTGSIHYPFPHGFGCHD